MKFVALFRGHLYATLVVAAALCSSATAQATESPIQGNAQALLGADVKGENWTVAPLVESDGFIRLYTIETPYGTFQVDGQRRMNERLDELRALQVLEKMSRTKAFGDAVVKAGMAPIRFGADLVTDPVATTGNFFTGVGNMFDNVVSSVSGKGSGRDPVLENISGMTGAERGLARTLGVDPYSDFVPLREGLADVARVMAAGDISVSAAISAIPGGAGIAVSAGSTADDLSTSIYSKTSNEIQDIVIAKLKGLGVNALVIDKFVKNHFFTPSDQFAIAVALEKLNAADSQAFVSRASEADSADVAKLNRYRAELLAKESLHLGTLKSFEIVSDVVLNRDAAGRLVAAFPFDDVAWTDTVSRSLTRISAEIAKRGESQKPVFATSGGVSAMAQDELIKLGWTIVKLD
jgi:hypothetical protein